MFPCGERLGVSLGNASSLQGTPQNEAQASSGERLGVSLGNASSIQGTPQNEAQASSGGRFDCSWSYPGNIPSGKMVSGEMLSPLETSPGGRF